MFNRIAERKFKTTDEILSWYSPEQQREILRDAQEWRREYIVAAKAKLNDRRFREPAQYFLARDPEELSSLTIRDFHDRLRAEACLLFKPSPNSDGELLLDAAYCDLMVLEVEPIVATFRSHRDSESNGVILRFDPFDQFSSLEYLFSDQWYVALDVPLLDRLDKLRGVIRVVRNRETGFPFSEQDRIIAALLAEKYVFALDQLQDHRRAVDDDWLSTILHELDAGLSAATDELSAGRVVLQQAARLVRADRADLVLWDEAEKDVVISAQFGKPVPEGIGIARRVPNPSIIREVWSKGGHKYLPNVQVEKGYHMADPDTKSELVFRIDRNDKAVGVLNVESYREDGFEERDVQWLRLLSQFASSAKVRGRKDSEQLGLLKQLTEPTMPATDVLKLALQGVKAYWGYDAGLVYYADFAKRRLICVESIGCDHLPQNCDITSFSYAFEEKSLACKVFHEKRPYFSEDPTTDDIVHPSGVAYFQIRGPLIGVPLVYEERAVGVMVVWSRQGTPPHRGSASHLEPFVQLAAPSIAAKADRKLQEAMVQAAEDILNIRQSSTSDQELLRRAIQSIHKAGFDRVRLFKYDPTERAFIGCVSEGMKAPEEFLHLKILVSENPYARDTAATAITNPHAREYRNQLGPDPDAQRLEKHPDVAWLVAPLVVHQRLYGKIVVDNATTGRAFERRNFEYLSFLATLLAETLANVESVETIRQRALPILLRHLRIQDSIEAFIRRFLVFITSGHGLGFSRAVFLQFDQSEKRLGPYDAIGSTTFEDFDRIAKEVSPLELDEQLRLAPAVSDEKLNLALEDFSFLLSDEQRRMIFDGGRAEGRRAFALQTIGNGSLASFAQELARRINGTHFLVAPLHSENAVSGLLVVDRSWQQRHISDTDHAQLEGFLDLAEFLLTDHAQTRRCMEWLHDDALIGQLARTLPRHLDSRGMRDLTLDVNAAKRQLIVLDFDGADTTLKSVEAKLAAATRSTELLDGLWNPKGELRTVHPRTLIACVVEFVKGQPGESSVEIRIQLGTLGQLQPLPMYYEALWRALYEVLINALEAVKKAPDSEKRIDISAEHVGDYLCIEILDTGPGISDEVLRARRYKVDAYTADPNKGLGYGLIHAQTVVECTHGGCFEIKRRPDQRGTRVRMRLPLAGPPKTQSLTEGNSKHSIRSRPIG